MASFTPQVKAILLEAGCRLVRQGKGDHEYWFSPVSGKSFPVDGKILSRHTANAIMKQAGLEFRFR